MSEHEENGEDLPDEEEDEAEVFESLGDAPLDEDIPEDQGDVGPGGPPEVMPHGDQA